VVAKTGTAPISRNELVAEFTASTQMKGPDKILDLDHLLVRLAEWRANGERIVFTNGCFDILHVGHITLLEQCREFGDKVVIGVNSDASVKQLKGPARPVVGEKERARVLAALGSTDAVIIFDQETPLELIRSLRPDVLVKGGDYTAANIVGADDITTWGGRVEIVPTVNGMSTTNTIRKMTAAAAEAGKELVVVTSRGELTFDGLPIKNFKPIGEFELPEYELQKLSFPPILQMLDYVQREGFSEIIISTPGPIGLTALLAAKMLNLETSGIYHTDFPQYIRILTEDSFLESLAWKYMHWFYGQLDTLFVNSEQYRQSWIERGIDAAKIKILPRGLDTQLFTPTRGAPDFWKQFGSNGSGVRLLYVGRVSKEKDLDVLVQAFRNLRQDKIPVQLSVVGHGPFSETLAELLPDACFTGYLTGTQLASAYASADIFVFPSTTDTFGNVIIEAQAAGLPVVVSDIGGPKELVADDVNGLITKARDATDFTRAIRRLVADEKLRQRMGEAARRSVQDRSWPTAFRKFWAMTEMA